MLWVSVAPGPLQSHSTPAADGSSSCLTLSRICNVDPSSPGETGRVMEWAQPLGQTGFGSSRSAFSSWGDFTSPSHSAIL